MGAVMLQAERIPEAMEAEKLKKEGGKCQFEGSIKGLRLHPIAFISHKTKEGMEKSMHSYVGEAATLHWRVEKFWKYCYGPKFTVVLDCSGLEQFFELDDHVHHAIRRWQAELL